jgi:phage-related protein
MFTLTDSLFYQNPPRAKVKHILPQIGEVEDFDIEWEFQQAGDDGDIFDIINMLLGGGGAGGGAGGAGAGGGAGGGGAGGAAGGGGVNLRRLIRDFEEYLQKQEELEKREREVVENVIKAFVDLHRVALEFGGALGDLTRTLAGVVYTTSPTLSALSEGLGAFAREASSAGRALGGISRGIVNIMDSFQKASSVLGELQRRFPSGPPSLPPIVGLGFPTGQQQQQPPPRTPQPPATRPIPLPRDTSRLPQAPPQLPRQLPFGIPPQILTGLGIPQQLIPRIGQLAASLGRLSAVLGPLAIVVVVVVAAFILFTQALQILLAALGPLTSVLNSIIQTIERGTQVVSIWERWRLAFSQFVQGALAGEQAWSRFVNMFSQFGITLDELARSLRTPLGDIGIMAAQGRISLEEWARMLGEIGRLGIRTGQQAEVLRAALEGRVHEAGGLGLPVGTAEAIAALRYGVAGMGETAVRAATAMSVLQMQIDNLSQQTSRAGQAIYAYNRIVGQLQTLYEEAGRTILEKLATPLRIFADVVRESRIADAFRTIAESFGNFAKSFLLEFLPYIENIADIINERVVTLTDTVRYIGANLGEALGFILRGIMDFLTHPLTQAAFGAFSMLFKELMVTLSEFVRIVGPPLMFILGVLAFLVGLFLKIVNPFLHILAEVMRFIGFLIDLLGRPFRRDADEEEEERRIRRRRAQLSFFAVATPPSHQVNTFNQALEALKRALEDNQQAALLAKRALEALSQEARAMAENYRRIQETMRDLSVLFTPQGTGAMWAPFQEFFRMLTQPELPQAARRAMERGKLLRGGLEEAIEFRIPMLQPIPVGYEEWAGVQLQAALREIDARIVEITSALATLNEEMLQTGYTLDTQLLQYYRQLAEAFRNLATQMENINRQTQEMVRGVREAYEITENWLRLRWGAEDLLTAGRYLENIANVSERLLLITKMRVESQAIEAERAARVLGIFTALVRRQMESLRRAGLTAVGEPQLFDPLRMSPMQAALFMQAVGLPYTIINQVITALKQLQQAWAEVFEVIRRGGEEIANVASAFRQLHEEIIKTSARFGDMIDVLLSGMQVLRSFSTELHGIGIRAAAALAAGRWEEYFRALSDGWRRFVDMFEARIEIIKRGIEAMLQPFNLYLDRFEMLSRALEKIGAQALLIPQLLAQIIPQGLQYLRVLEQMAQQYRDHPLLLQEIFRAWEQGYNRVMTLLGQVAGGILPAIPLSELARISQMPVFAVREMARWAREGGPVPFAPEVRMMGVPPLIPAQLAGMRVGMEGRTVLSWGDLADFMLSAYRMLPQVRDTTIREIQQQLLLDLTREILNPFRRWVGDVQQWGMEWRRRVDRRVEEAFAAGVLGGAAGLARERVPFPGFEGVPGWQPELAIPPQALEVPVRLRIQLDNNKIPIEFQLRKPDGGYVTVPKTLEVTPVSPEDISRRHPPNY